MNEPELITVLEGPTPDFRVTPQLWSQAIQQGPLATQVAVCELRTGNGQDILERCRQAWHEGRPVQLDFPDEIRMRQRVDVVAMRLRELPEGTLLLLWVQEPLTFEEGDDDADEEDDDVYS